MTVNPRKAHVKDRARYVARTLAEHFALLEFEDRIYRRHLITTPRLKLVAAAFDGFLSEAVLNMTFDPTSQKDINRFMGSVRAIDPRAAIHSQS